MPPAIPDRFKLEIRLGRDGDIEEWLATDTSLDRPVLIRSLGPETSPERRRQFVDSVSQVAKVSHSHLARVFVVEQVDGGAYSVSEWTGGSTVADRIEAQHPIEIPDFLPNASGVSGALAALHHAGVAHGGIDLSAISYSSAHAAKLGAFGRVPHADMAGDVRDLSAALETALTGSEPEGPAPSERIDGLPRAIDRILRAGQRGALDAEGLEKALRAAPTPRLPAPEPKAGSRRLIVAALVLVGLAVGLVALGRVVTGGGQPILPNPVTTTSPSPSTSGGSTPGTDVAADARIENAAAFDPFGGAGENDEAIPHLYDDDLSTTWSTETYEQPLSETKEGVGVTFSVEGSPARIQLIGLTPDTGFELYWSAEFFAQPGPWERIAGASATPGTVSLGLPARDNGFWLVWLTDLPQRPDGLYHSTIAEVRFLP